MSSEQHGQLCERGTLLYKHLIHAVRRNDRKQEVFYAFRAGYYNKPV